MLSQIRIRVSRAGGRASWDLPHYSVDIFARSRGAIFPHLQSIVQFATCAASITRVIFLRLVVLML